MKLSIITINYNDAVGLQKTVASVLAQTARAHIEYIVIDGGSTDGSAEYLESITDQLDYWHSKRDKGIYNAMNIGIQKATGDYVQILNAGDVFASETVVERMMQAWEERDCPEFIYGNMIKKDYTTGMVIGRSGEVPYSLLNYFTATMNHDCCWIKRTWFVNDNHNDNQNQCYGLYEEELKIVSDWKWFLQAIGLGIVKPVYVDIDMTIFDASGISEKNLGLRNEERRKVLKEMLPPAVLADYDKYAFPMHQYNRLKKYHLWGLVYFVERILFKLEKWHILK